MSETEEKQCIVSDVHGHGYTLTKLIGHGAQGAVWCTSHPNVLVKLSTIPNGIRREQWQSHIAWLMRQNLTRLKLARPLAMLEAPHAGYIMELMDGLVPLTSLFETQFLENAEGFLATGGLIRRLRLLRQLASTLSRLHGLGMHFGDLSPNNIFISGESDHSEVWLIDCDNISLEARPCRPLYTQDYGAPEVVRGDALSSTLTDAWSFAVIAWQMLTISHPLKGEVVVHGDPELEEQALRGEFPWVYDPDDASNLACGGIPKDLVTTSHMARLFAQCFGPGKADSQERPSMSAWQEALHEASERTITCTDCASSYLFTPEKQCPFCEGPLDENHVLVHEYEFTPLGLLPEGSASRDCWLQTGRFVVLQPGGEVQLRPNLPTFLEGLSGKPLVRLAWRDSDLLIDPLESVVSLQRGKTASPLKGPYPLKGDFRGNDREPYWLRIGKPDEPMTVWRFAW